MLAIYIIGGIILFIILLMFSPLWLRIKFSENLSLFAGISFIGIKLLPAKEKKEKPKKTKKKKEKKKVRRKEKKKAAEENKKEQKKEKKSFSQLKSELDKIAEILKELLKRLGKATKIKVKQLEITVGGSDAADAAIKYGLISQSVCYIFDFLEELGKVRYSNGAKTGVYVNFLSDDWNAKVDLSIKIRLYKVLGMLIKALLMYIK